MVYGFWCLVSEEVSSWCWAAVFWTSWMARLQGLFVWYSSLFTCVHVLRASAMTFSSSEKFFFITIKPFFLLLLLFSHNYFFYITLNSIYTNFIIPFQISLFNKIYIYYFLLWLLLLLLFYKCFNPYVQRLYFLFCI